MKPGDEIKKRKRKKRKNKNKKEAVTHYFMFESALVQGSPRYELLNQEGLAHPMRSMLAISSSQSGINVQHIPPKIYNTSDNDHNLQALGAPACEV